jgi:hypothetical protein
MERVTAELRDGLIAGIRGEALHLEMRDRYAAMDHSRYRRWVAGEKLDPAGEAEFWRPWREMMQAHRAAGRPGGRPDAAPPAGRLRAGDRLHPVRVAGRARAG